MKTKKKKIPRKLKKRVHKAQLIIDSASLPMYAGDNLMERTHNIIGFFRSSGVLLWDSSVPGNPQKPEIIGCKNKLRVIDSSKNTEIRNKFLNENK